jgi:hypothetical protein
VVAAQEEAQLLHVLRPQRDRGALDRAVDLGRAAAFVEDLDPERPGPVERACTQRDTLREGIARAIAAASIASPPRSKKGSPPPMRLAAAAKRWGIQAA